MVALNANRPKITELGAGSVGKTKVLLEVVAQAPQICHDVEYYALDINREALANFLVQMPELKKISCRGLFGTYKSRLHHFAKMRQRSDINKVPRVFMWLGTGIGNMTMDVATDMVKSIAEVMFDGDLILIGIDGWTSDKFIHAAYKAADKLVLNTLKNANEISRARCIRYEQVCLFHTSQLFEKSCRVFLCGV